MAVCNTSHQVEVNPLGFIAHFLWILPGPQGSFHVAPARYDSEHYFFVCFLHVDCANTKVVAFWKTGNMLVDGSNTNLLTTKKQESFELTVPKQNY